MFTMGLVHIWNLGPGCSIADTKPTTRSSGANGLIYMPSEGDKKQGVNTPHGTPGGPQVDPKVLVAQHT